MADHDKKAQGPTGQTSDRPSPSRPQLDEKGIDWSKRRGGEGHGNYGSPTDTA